MTLWDIQLLDVTSDTVLRRRVHWPSKAGEGACDYSKIQTWLSDTNFSNIQIWKGSNVRMHTCILRVPWHGPRVNRGFNSIQQQPSNRSRQQQATHLRVPFFWTENTWTYSMEDCGCPLIHSTLTWSNTPLLTPCSTSLAKLANYSYI